MSGLMRDRIILRGRQTMATLVSLTRCPDVLGEAYECLGCGKSQGENDDENSVYYRAGIGQGWCKKLGWF